MTRSVVRGPLREQVLMRELGPLHARIVADVELAARTGAGRTDLPAETVAHLIEGAAFTVLDESLRRPMTRQEGRRLVVLAGLGALGLSWREANDRARRHADRPARAGGGPLMLEILDVGDRRRAHPRAAAVHRRAARRRPRRSRRRRASAARCSPP